MSAQTRIVFGKRRNISKPVFAGADLARRRCLSCFKLFWSEWAGERKCKLCKKSVDYAAGVDYTTYSVGMRR